MIRYPGIFISLFRELYARHQSDFYSKPGVLQKLPHQRPYSTVEKPTKIFQSPYTGRLITSGLAQHELKLN